MPLQAYEGACEEKLAPSRIASNVILRPCCIGVHPLSPNHFSVSSALGLPVTFANSAPSFSGGSIKMESASSLQWNHQQIQSYQGIYAQDTSSPRAG